MIRGPRHNTYQQQSDTPGHHLGSQRHPSKLTLPFPLDPMVLRERESKYSLGTIQRKGGLPRERESLENVSPPLAPIQKKTFAPVVDDKKPDDQGLGRSCHPGLSHPYPEIGS